MSGAVMQFNPVAPVDPIAGAQRLAQLGQTQVNTGLIGQQVQAAEIANRLAGAQAALVLPKLASLAGTTGASSGPGAVGNPNAMMSPNATTMDFVGTVPKMAQIGIYAAPPSQWGTEIQRLLQNKKAIIAQTLGAAMGPDGRMDPQAYNQQLGLLYQMGWMSGADLAGYVNRPDRGTALYQSYAPVEQQPSFKEAQSYAEGVGRARTTPQSYVVPNPQGGMTPVVTSTANVLGLGSPSPLSRNVGQFESGGNPTTPNRSGPGGTPTTSAQGLHQYTDGTWLEAVQKYRPDLMQGRSRAQILALRNDPAISSEIFDARGPELAGNVSSITGGTATDSSVALSHFLGPDGFKTFVSASPDARFADVLPAFARTNPTYANRTIGQVAQQFANRFGNGQYQPNGSVSGGGIVAPTGAPAGAVQTGPVTYSTEEQKNIDRVNKYQEDLQEQATSAKQMGALIEHAMPAMNSYVSGPLTPAMMGAKRYLVQLGNMINDQAGSKLIDVPRDVSQWEASGKDMLQVASSMVKAMASRVTNFEFQTFQNLLPNDKTSPAGRQMVFDQLLGLNDYLQAKNAMASRMRPAKDNVNAFEAGWNQQVSPEAFIIHRMSQADFQAFAHEAAKDPTALKRLQGWVAQAGQLEREGLMPGNP